MIEAVHRQEIAVRTIDIDDRGLVHPVALAEYVLDSAGGHAALGGLAVTDLMRRGVTWVLSRFHIRVDRWPAWGRSLIIETWPSGRAPLYAVRDFVVSDAAGPLASATSSWLIVDLKTRRPARIEGYLVGFPLLEKRALADDFASLPGLDREDARLEFPVFASDIDFNRHVTASVYIHRALESVPEDFLFHRRPASIEVNFRGEAFYGDRITSRLQRLDGGEPASFLHRLSRAADDKELTLLRTVWR